VAQTATPSNRSTTPLSSSTKKSQTSRKNEPVATVVEVQKEAIAEAHRHNLEMEELERLKLEQMKEIEHLKLQEVKESKRREIEEMKESKKREMERSELEFQQNAKIARLKQQDMELAHQLAVVEAYEKIKGKLSKAMILKKFPEMADLIETESNSNE
jgi:hypothetical protein